jgi:hypothetical protein
MKPLSEEYHARPLPVTLQAGTWPGIALSSGGRPRRRSRHRPPTVARTVSWACPGSQTFRPASRCRPRHGGQGSTGGSVLMAFPEPAAGDGHPGPMGSPGGGTLWATGSFGQESSRHAPMDSRGFLGRTRWGTATRLAPSDPPAWPYADSSGASGASGAFDASGAFGAFGFAARLPDRTERNARRTGAPEAAPPKYATSG